jgi:NaMN:DMB phosphoribosyltransferase
MFGPNQVGELIVGGTVAAQTTVAAFVASAADKVY